MGVGELYYDAETWSCRRQNGFWVGLNCMKQGSAVYVRFGLCSSSKTTWPVQKNSDAWESNCYNEVKGRIVLLKMVVSRVWLKNELLQNTRNCRRNKIKRCHLEFTSQLPTSVNTSGLSTNVLYLQPPPARHVTTLPALLLSKKLPVRLWKKIATG